MGRHVIAAGLRGKTGLGAALACCCLFFTCATWRKKRRRHWFFAGFEGTTDQSHQVFQSLAIINGTNILFSKIL